MKLHRIHANAQSTRLEFNSLDLTWRGEGRSVSLADKMAIAHRLALCWNLCEGMPTELLEGGLLRDVAWAVRDGDLAKAQELQRQLDDGRDLTDGRLHDCASCLGGTARIEDEPDADR